MRQRKEQPHKSSTAKRNRIILFVAVIICSLLIQAGLGLEKTALSPTYYRSLLDDSELQQDIWSRLWTALTGQEKLPGTDSAVYRAFRRSFDEEWWKDQLGQAITGALDFVKGAEHQLAIVLDIKDQKAIFRQELLRLAGQPATSKLAASLAGFLREEVVPDSYLLISIDSPADLAPKVSQDLATLQKARLWFRYAPYVAYGLLLLLALFWGGMGSGLKWFGGGILASGIIFALITTLLHKATFVQLLLQKSALLKAVFTAYPELMVKAIASAQGTLLRSALLQAVVGLVIIGAGFAAGRIAKKFGGNKGMLLLK